MRIPGCPLCDGLGGIAIFGGVKFRLMRADEAGFPAFYRLVWSDHVAEFSDLEPPDRRLCLDAVVHVELALRAHLRPTKVNLATLGNAVPHLHWHVIARFTWDSHFPGSVWSAATREAPAEAIAAIERMRPALESDLSERLAALTANSAAA
jgi:diadenosine tetraphosphate (Ap4A) HIT family hydrolase